uniref:Uncharacterized protein n=1 Tax=Triticum urartu TaxID=4572 RepID=A0A8R7TXM0_TRIUA
IGTLDLIFAVVEPPADLERCKGVGASILQLVPRQPRRVPGADPHVVRLLGPHAHHLPHEALQPGVPQRRLPQHVRGEVAQVHRVRHLQPVVSAELLRVAVDPDADEGEAAVGEEVEEGVRDVVGAEDLEDEAAAADAQLQQRDGARREAAERGAPLDVEADDEAVEAAAVDAVDEVQPLVDDAAGGGQGGVDVVLVERHDAVAVAEVRHHGSRHLDRPPEVSNCCLV